MQKCLPLSPLWSLAIRWILMPESRPLTSSRACQKLLHWLQPISVYLIFSPSRLADTVPAAIDSSLLVDAAEQQLAESISALSSTIAPLLEQRDYAGVLKELASLRGPVDQFFDDVMVMVDDPAIRDNRLALLNSLRSLFLNVADISQLVVSK